jgi:Immunity protein 32
MILTIELLAPKIEIQSKDVAEVAICFDKEGLEKLISQLQRLQNKKDHIHLMTSEWTGSDLTSEKHGGDNYILINHLRIVRI